MPAYIAVFKSLECNLNLELRGTLRGGYQLLKAWSKLNAISRRCVEHGPCCIPVIKLFIGDLGSGSFKESCLTIHEQFKGYKFFNINDGKDLMQQVYILSFPLSSEKCLQEGQNRMKSPLCCILIHKINVFGYCLFWPDDYFTGWLSLHFLYIFWCLMLFFLAYVSSH